MSRTTQDVGNVLHTGRTTPLQRVSNWGGMKKFKNVIYIRKITRRRNTEDIMDRPRFVLPAFEKEAIVVWKIISRKN